MTLQDWPERRCLSRHDTSRQEIRDLRLGASQDFNDSRVPGLSAGGRFNLAYNAVLKLATAALAASGYRASREQHHLRVIGSLAFTIRADSSLVDMLDRFRRKRNISMYESPGSISDQEADEMVSLAEELQALIGNWLRERFPDLA